MTKRLLPAILVILVMAGSAVYGTWRMRQAKNPDPNHTHADFAIWANKKKLDFSDPIFMSTEQSEAELPENDIGRYLHLHDGNGHVVHRHKPGLTFDDFLKTIGVYAQCLTELGKEGETCTKLCLSWHENHVYSEKNVCVPKENAKMFINGKEVPYNLAYDFQDDDQILVMYGSTPDQIQEALQEMTDDACLYSKTCPWRGAPPGENCIADPMVPCVAP